MFILLSGIAAVVLSLIGCCTSRVHDRCCILCFTIIISIIFLVFTVFGLLMISINLQSDDFVKNYCTEGGLTKLQTSDQQSSFNNFFIKLAKDLE